MDVFDIVKAKLPTIDETEIAMHIAEVGMAIKTYINQRTIPAELVFVHANMVVDLIKGEERRVDPAAQVAVASVKEGDATVQFGSAKLDSREHATEKLLFDFSSQLNKFRKMRW